MTKLERVQATLRREPTDRPPYAFWRHFPDVDRSAAALAQATLRFHERYGPDFLTVTPRAGSQVEDWGCVESDEAAPDGHRPCARHAVREAADWKKIRPLGVDGTGWGAQLETIIRCVVDRRADCSTVATVRSPLSLAQALAGERLGYDLEENPQAVTGALEAITETICVFLDACFVEGVEGILYAIRPPSAGAHAEDHYVRFGEPYDRRILERQRSRSRLTIVHGHGRDRVLERLAALPADAWSWDEPQDAPALAAGLARVPGAVIGGLDRWAALRYGPPEAVKAEAQGAIAETGGRGLILGAGCVLPPGTSDLALVDLIRSIGGQVKLGLIKPQ